MLAKFPKLPRLHAPFGTQLVGLVDLRLGINLGVPNKVGGNLRKVLLAES